MVQGIKYPECNYDNEDSRIIIEVDEALEKRATKKENEYAKGMDEYYQVGVYDGYILGATEQKTLMIEKACKILEESDIFNKIADKENFSAEVLKGCFIQAMEND